MNCTSDSEVFLPYHREKQPYMHHSRPRCSPLSFLSNEGRLSNNGAMITLAVVLLSHTACRLSCIGSGPFSPLFIASVPFPRLLLSTRKFQHYPILIYSLLRFCSSENTKSPANAQSSPKCNLFAFIFICLHTPHICDIIRQFIHPKTVF